ncbi:hypothetical protein [Salipaludibacillus aurantiacus]|uniref:Uncharacterized protein n=1 Tax=Salipaludibacillus aurantiacus TaxID=1601833 RepID=A0A1H9T3T8_9BACI|nr:hypothetical protein [Salipaludibacillus aurantiacus]SER91912.1 hypothetical protein SAMN05518684_105108 [Salipaludibacillus aurantiacus]
MIQLAFIENHYPFCEFKWIEEGKIIETEKGKKRVEIWTDKETLDAHIEWREKLAKETDSLTDRMIQTANGDKAVETDTGWLTLHDYVDHPYPVTSNVKQTGHFIGMYASVKMDNSMGRLNLANWQEDALFLSKSIKLKLKQKGLIERLRVEAEDRVKKAEVLFKEESAEEAASVLSIESPSQAKMIYGRMYWENQGKSFQNKYLVLRSFLKEWVEANGTGELTHLFDGLDETFPLREQKGRQLLAAIVYPHEYISFMKWLNEAGESTEIEERVNSLMKEWDIMKTLTEHVAEWIREPERRLSNV